MLDRHSTTYAAEPQRPNVLLSIKRKTDPVPTPKSSVRFEYEIHDERYLVDLEALIRGDVAAVLSPCRERLRDLATDGRIQFCFASPAFIIGTEALCREFFREMLRKQAFWNRHTTQAWGGNRSRLAARARFDPRIQAFIFDGVPLAKRDAIRDLADPQSSPSTRRWKVDCPDHVDWEQMLEILDRCPGMTNDDAVARRAASAAQDCPF